MKTAIYKNAKGIRQRGIYRISTPPEKSKHYLVWSSKIISRNKVKALGKKLRAKGLKIAFTPGSYDMIHVGHARYLALGKSLGDVLVVGLNSDSSIKAYKGNDRPILNQDKRAEMLAHLVAVDYVVIFDETFEDGFFSTNVIKELKPDRLLCVEETWEGRLEERPEVKAVLEYGGEVFCSARQDPALSTSKIIMKLMEDGKRELIKDMGQILNKDDSLKGSL